MSLKVCKFGGSSLADGNNISRVTEIIGSEPARRFVVVSAPGKRYSDDTKVTDLLYACYQECVEKGSCADTFQKIRRRFHSIVSELGMETFDIESILNETERAIEENKSADFTASRGEYLNARIVAAKLGWAFVDAKDIIFFDKNGRFDESRSYPLIEKTLSASGCAVVPGFYGTGADGKIKTFSRGGSDISGSIVARAMNADVYENWTDVSGFLACDPRIVDKPEKIETISFKELRELSYMGANVLHADSIFPVRKGDIPIRIKNTFRPQDSGTLILPSKKYVKSGNIVTGIAGKKDFTVIFLEKSMMNSEVGFARKVLSILEQDNINFEHMPSGIDTLSLVIESKYLANGMLDKLLEQIQAAVHPDYLRVLENIALVATVGHGMASNVGTSARLFTALSDAGINIRMIDQGSSEINIIVGIDNADYEKCIRAIYAEFFRKDKAAI
ncbi:MAG TPA: aspartate kinase [Candidatus Borkfalkia excrementipullorum]|nr:aspartate kinase [Candidatus Borkfalkia excrementipullorum]